MARMQFTILFACVASAAALNIGFGAKPATATQVGRVVPTRRGGKVPEPEPEGLDLQQVATDVCVTTLRIGTCALMYHHGIDKIQARCPPSTAA